ncbi:hypothetical protein [uncultured Metabacillus sp.]|uniref:hypothetical protein n=1 Tax=uncultured Metabacillus sp. TaxID=2860135 RepID=UPI00261EA3FE|nr:hypothetical protein [uncultured Metabacillus sp.]
MFNDYYGKYKNLLRLDERENVSTNLVISENKQFFNDSFNDSLFYQIVLINDVEFEAIVKQEKKSEDKKLVLRPDTEISVGSVVSVNNSSYLAIDFLNEGINEIYPTATLKLCNSIFPIPGEITKVLIGTDPKTGRPIYDEQVTYTSEPCIVESQYSKSSEVNQFKVPEGTLVISMKYQTSEKLKIDYEFEMYGSKYKVANFDYTGVIGEKGIMKIIAEKVV